MTGAGSVRRRRLPVRLWLRLSLRTRLTVIATVAVAVAVLAVSAAAGISFAYQLRRSAEERLRTDAQPTLAGLAEGGAARAPLPPYLPDGPLVRVVLPDGSTRTPSGQSDVLPPAGDGAGRVVRGEARETFEVDERTNDEVYLVYTRQAPGGAVQVFRDGRFYKEALTTLAAALLVIGLVGVMGAAFAGRAVARAGLAPVDRLTGAAVRVARTKDLNASIAPEGAGEIGRLVAAINDMLAALRSSREAQRMLAENAAHELNTPLTSLRANIELLIRVERPGSTRKALAAPARARLLEDLGGQVVELSNLVAELTDLARGDISVENAEVLEFADVIGAAVVRARSRNPGVDVVTDLRPAPVLGRPAALQRAVLNLLDNAAKFSPPDEPLAVRLTAEGGWVCLEVDDAGPGIDEDDRSRVFERFYRGPAVRALPGSGLGLSIVRQVVDGHGGWVRVERSARGGALLRLALPAVPDAAPPAVREQPPGAWTSGPASQRV